MKEEIAAAVVFMSRLIRLNDSITKEKADKFSDHLEELLLEKFKNHWYAENPQKGQAYRCIRITPVSPIDPLLNKAATLSGLNYSDLRLPTELTIWIDPQEVSCRFGETHGASCMLTSFKDGKLQTYAHRVDIRELVEEQNKRDNKHINIVTTRINKPHPEYPQSRPFDQPAFPTYTYIPTYFEPIYFQPIYFEPIYLEPIYFEPIYFEPIYFESTQRCAGFNPNPFYIDKQRIRQNLKDNVYGNYNTYYGNKAYGFSSRIEMNLAIRSNLLDKNKYRWIRGKQQNRADHLNVGTKCSTNCSNQRTDQVKVGTTCSTNCSNKQTDPVKVDTTCITNCSNKQTDHVTVGTTCSTNCSNQRTDQVKVGTTCSTNCSNKQNDPVKVASY